MPAEWEPHSATWLSWLHNENSWPGRLQEVEPVYARMVAALAELEAVHINVSGPDMERHARSLLSQAGAHGEIMFHHFPTNDAWCRDHGAVFVVREGAENTEPVAAINWGFNAWGGKYPHNLDNAIPSQMAGFQDVPLFEGGMVLEGGSIDVNGSGLLLTTEACLLHPNRNPHLDRGTIEQRLRDFLAVEEVLWLGDGIEGDDTDGHIDDLARFVAERVVVTTVEADPHDANYQLLQDNLARLRAVRTRDGRPLEIVELPMPPAVVYEGQRLPATYANFYIGNRIVLLPGYHPPTDEVARKILAGLFPGREIVVIDCTELIWGLGAFHCLTQQVPAAG